MPFDRCGQVFLHLVVQNGVLDRVSQLEPGFEALAKYIWNVPSDISDHVVNVTYHDFVALSLDASNPIAS
jgi:hypothetical protein